MEHLTLEVFKEKICECGIGGTEKAEWKYKESQPSVIRIWPGALVLTK